MPKLWNETIEEHRKAVREAVMDATATLVAHHGLAAVTMSRIAEDTGIGRATLYKYFPDVQAIILAWHERQILRHLEQLAEVRERTVGGAADRLGAVLGAYALILHDHEPTVDTAALHRGEHVGRAQHQLTGFVTDLIAEGVGRGELRDDIAADELARYCLHALTAATGLPTRDGVQRLVQVTVDGLRRR
ncbi:TetR family transcriptional regulator (plasmid) [Rhodococcus oxybenzonivorans]|uniref:TetR family transcriptional regulator n=1 Tax=Rhodococcus oxybenzonivorans TaxID=1990687 RepID=A0A2S2C7H8_9NOCA|nr:TetR/AcrR family transcriptional regulator [Rhodococcus oxybenzonivorans]AWK76753.1 TetR family transcriptional regulator [Rhodococcus oxybenzonivorans]